MTSEATPVVPEATPAVPEATPAAAEQTAPRTRSTQDRIMENKIIAAEQLAKILPAETDLAETLSEADYGAQELVRFDTLQQKAWKDYGAQGLAAGEQKNATKRFLASEKAARKSFVKERGKGKAAFMKDPIGREIVGLNGTIPGSLIGLIGAGRKLAGAVDKPEYAVKLAKKGVTAAKLADLGVKLDALEAADQEQVLAKSAASVALLQRNASAQELFDWVAEFRTFAKAEFKDHPEILKRWGFK